MTCACKMSGSDLGKSFGGYSTFAPMRHADELDDEMERTAASGQYGFTKGVQASVETTTRKLARFTNKTAKELWSKDPKTAEFLAIHARKASSLPAKALLAAMSEIGPKVAKVAATRTHGLYGFRNKTAKNALVACQAVREESGYLAHGLATRRADKFADLMAYMEKHCGETDCPYTTLLMQAMPEDKFELLKVAQDSGAGSSAHKFFDDPRRRDVREFALSKAPTNFPAVVPKIVEEYEVTDVSQTKMKAEVRKTPDTPTETLKATPGSDQFSTLSKYIVMTEQTVKKMPKKIPDGHEEVKKAPELSVIHDLVAEKYLAKMERKQKRKR